jgi:hypothetical protein
MRRHLVTALLWGVVVYALYRWGAGLLLGGKVAVPLKAGDFGPISSVLAVAIVLAWVVIRAGEAVCDVADMVSGARARRAKQRRWRERVARTGRLVNGHGEIKTGHEPPRLDAVADHAA